MVTIFDTLAQTVINWGAGLAGMPQHRYKVAFINNNANKAMIIDLLRSGLTTLAAHNNMAANWHQGTNAINQHLDERNRQELAGTKMKAGAFNVMPAECGWVPTSNSTLMEFTHGKIQTASPPTPMKIRNDATASSCMQQETNSNTTCNYLKKEW